MPRLVNTVVVLAVVLVACGIGEGARESTPPATAAFDCEGLAERWVRLQQEYLDRLGDADVAELEAGSDRVDAAAAWFGPALIEQVRDADAVGCEAVLRAGSPELCARVDRLEPEGRLAQQVVDDLDAGCAGG